MELLALHKTIKKPPRSDERDGELFCGTDLSLGAGVTGVNSGGSTGTVTYTITNAAASGAKELGFTCNRASNTSYSVSGATIKARAAGGLGSVFILENLTNSIKLVAWHPGTSDPGYGYYFIAK